MLKSTIALIKDDISLRRYFKAFSFSMNNLVKTKTLKWEEWPPPKQYQGFLPPINVKDIKDLIRTKKVDYDFVDVDIDNFLPNYKYQSRKELLDLIQRYELNEKKKRTYLYRSKGAKRCNQFELLYRNIIQFGFRDYEYDSKDRNGELPPCYIDMPDIGIRVDGTNRAAIKKIKQESAEKVYTYSTHPVFSKPAPGNIFKLGISEMVVADTIPITRNYKKLQVLSVASLLSSAIKNIHQNKSVSALFN